MQFRINGKSKNRQMQLKINIRPAEFVSVSLLVPCLILGIGGDSSIPLTDGITLPAIVQLLGK